MEGKRFVTHHTIGGTCFIKDTRDDSLVCIMLKYGREKGKTDAMCDVMLKALNDAVENRRTASNE